MKQKKCHENYDDGCVHREIIHTPFSKDWCRLKNDYCNNQKPTSSGDKKS